MLNPLSQMVPLLALTASGPKLHPERVKQMRTEAELLREKNKRKALLSQKYGQCHSCRHFDKGHREEGHPNGARWCYMKKTRPTAFCGIGGCDPTPQKTHIFTSHAEWPGDIPDSHDDHYGPGALGEAAHVCRMLELRGMGGDREVFPVRTWVTKRIDDSED